MFGHTVMIIEGVQQRTKFTPLWSSYVDGDAELPTLTTYDLPVGKANTHAQKWLLSQTLSLGNSFQGTIVLNAEL